MSAVEKGATRAQLEKAVDAVGGEIDWGDSGLTVDTPRGYVWKSIGHSSIAVQFSNKGGQSWRPKAYAEALELMAMGIEEAEDAADPDAGYWWSEEED